MRYQGKLKKWNAERGFGFIVADDGGQLPRGGLGLIAELVVAGHHPETGYRVRRQH